MLKRTLLILVVTILGYSLFARADDPVMRVPDDWQFKTSFWDWQFQEVEEEAVDYGYGLIARVNNHHLRAMVDSLTLAQIVGPRTE